jgi:dienelactone hydrolase
MKTEAVSYISRGMECNGFVAYDEKIGHKLPVVIIVHEWWGLNDYARSRAVQIANLGYFAFAADLFGSGRTAPDPPTAMALTKPYYSDPENTLEPIEAALAKAGSFPQADLTNAAAMGYCFGGYVVINAAKLGVSLKGVVSFHGRLTGVAPRKEITKARFLICQGGADQLAPEADQISFKKSMDEAGIAYEFITYPGAQHAYSNPNATELGEKFKMPIAYNAAADAASWRDMEVFFEKIFKK